MPKTPVRTVRIEDDLWFTAMSTADSGGLSVSDVIRAALQLYVESPGFRRQVNRRIGGLTPSVEGVTLVTSQTETTRRDRTVPNTSDLMTTEELAELLRKPPSWVHNNAGPLGIPRYRLGNHYRYSESKVLDWLEQQEEQ